MIPVDSTFQTALSSFQQGHLPVIVTIEGYSRVFTRNVAVSGTQVNWLVSMDDFSTSINDLDGGADVSQLSFTVQDRGGAVTGDFPSFVFEGKKCTVQIGLPGVDQSHWPVYFTGYIDTVASTNSNLEYYFTVSDTSTKLSATVYQVGDDGVNAVSSTNPRTVSAHPIDIMVAVCEAAGVDSSLIDTAKLNVYRDTIFAGQNFVFRLTAPVAAGDFVKNQLLKPLGGYLWVNSSGQITANFFYPMQGPTPVAILGPGAWIAIPSAEQTDMVNAVQIQFDKDDSNSGSSGNYMSQSTQEYGASVSLYGLVGEDTVQADGVRSAYQGFYLAALVSRMIFMRYGFKNLKFDQDAADAIWQCSRLEPGDVVAVTHPGIPDRKAGVVGVTGKLFEVLDRTIKFNEGLVLLTLIDADYLSSFGQFLIAPDAVSDYASESPTNKSKYMYMCGDDDKYSDGSAAHVLG